MRKYINLFCALALAIGSAIPLHASHNPDFSTAGFYQLDGTGREVYSMNPAWRFHKGAFEGAEATTLDDSLWEVVSIPNGIEYLPVEASGCMNYQGEVWYRKHFTPADELKNRKLFLNFEAIMGKSKVFVNGEQLSEHFGGYLPIVVDITDKLKWGEDNVIAVWADNSDDPNYPPGKQQDVLDFTYFGGLYRDCWLVAHGPTYITNPNYEDVVAGGGLFVAYDNVSDKKADVLLSAHIRNEAAKPFSGSIEYELVTPDGKCVQVKKEKVKAMPGGDITVKSNMTVKSPDLWSPEKPNLYNLLVRIKDNKGKVVDGYRQRIGIRSIEFKGADGFWLNGKPYEGPLIGANRHQDFAVLGNAVPNSIHWRDAKKLRDLGLKVIRNAHCPQDPAFLDACDELGLLVINNTPGWQFWNDAPLFAQRVYSDIRNLVRRDRNHACIWIWEPILNETNYPADFAARTQEVVNEEYPYNYCYSSCDSNAKGHEAFKSILFAHPRYGEPGRAMVAPDSTICYFTREWGDYVDDWNSHNSPSRVARQWGESPMLVQAAHYALPETPFASYDILYRTTRQHVGGCLWHSFDHQRGYHPDPFYGGIMDVYRQPKYSYYMFKAQRSPEVQEDVLFETGPSVFIANEMTPFSPHDVTVYSNCDEVRLTVNKDGKVYTYTKSQDRAEGMPSPIIVFNDVFSFAADRKLSRQNLQDDVFLLAEGLIDGEVVAVHERRPARRPTQILLWIDNEDTQLKADGSDAVTVVAAIADANGNIKRLNNSIITFEIEGEGTIVGDDNIQANPAIVKWGTAPVLVKSTLNPGKIKLTARMLHEGSERPVSGTIEFESVSPDEILVFDANEAELLTIHNQSALGVSSNTETLDEEALRAKANRLKEVEQQQEQFGEK